jgi:GNAT superfamily N-acetyltransferase
MAETDTDPADIPGTDDLHDVEGAYLDAGGDFLVGVIKGNPAVVTRDSDGDASRLPPATFDGTLVAAGGFCPTGTGRAEERAVDGAAELHRMRVAPTHQRRGYGRTLLSRLEDRARRLGFETMVATTARTQPAAVAFYPDMGYRQVDTSTVDGYDLVHFEKTL